MTNLYKLLFYMTMMMGTLIAISSYSWMGMWMGLEINLLSIIPLMSSSKNLLSSESSLKYFITQAIASTILLFSIIMMMYLNNMINNTEWNNLMTMMMNSALFTKMGAAPFHFWFPEVMEGLSWMNCIILLTWQKIAPMVLLMYNTKTINLMITIILFSMVISGIIGINQTSLRKIMAYSSINHIAWMISTTLFIESAFTIYFIIYSIISLNIILMFKNLNIFYLGQLFPSMNSNPHMKMFFIMNFLSLGGLPPFLGFFPKWLTIHLMINNNMLLLPFIMVILTLITLYFYMRITFSSMLMNMEEPNWNTLLEKKMIKNQTIMIFNFISIISLVICTLMFSWL
uniref:NADH-ubiquinone oxidoreductase chain 2 n=1 Tax=Simianus niponicus TaxID=3107951 RepID=A0A343A4H0_9COLE|nr:NADH dehydrogenase subunit 2 [Simianus niponicus]AOY39448.1 NADH dehydrogenase subunit 2 [Simianus niponicus]